MNDELRLAISRAIALETPRGWRIAKETTSHKIDAVVALAMAAVGATEGHTDRSEALAWLQMLQVEQKGATEPSSEWSPQPQYYDIDRSPPPPRQWPINVGPG